MFDDFYARLPLDNLGRESDFFLQNGLRPEIYVSDEALRRLGKTGLGPAGSILAAFPGHTLHAPFIDVFPGAQDADVRALSFAKLNRVMDIAREWGSRLVVMHFNYDPVYYRHHVDDWIARAGEFFARLLRPGEESLIALENVADTTPYVAARLLAAISHPRAVHCLDLGHHHVFAHVPFAEWLLYLAPQDHVHFHFHDNDGGEDDHLPLGEGTIDWRHVREVLANLQCRFSVGLEPHSQKDLRRTLDFYKKFFLHSGKQTFPSPLP